MTFKLVLLIFFVCGLPNAISIDEAFKLPRQDEEFGSKPYENVTNVSNTSTTCHLKFDPSTFENVLRSIRYSKKNAIELNVWVKSANGTAAINKTFLSGLNWANEMGRTLITLIAQPKNHPSMILSSYTNTLAAGVGNVDIGVSEENEGCLSANETSGTDILLYSLLHQLPQFNGDKPGFQLCIKDNDDKTKFNCCGVIGTENIMICSEYSSVLTQSFTVLNIALVMIALFLVFPSVFEHASRAKKERTHYKISDSPMSLSSIMYKIFIEGHGPVKSLGRRLVFALLIVVTVLPSWTLSFGQCIIYTWALIFPFFDVFTLNGQSLGTSTCSNELRRLYSQHMTSFIVNNRPVTFFALPFNFKLLWNEVNRRPFLCKHFKLKLNRDSTSKQPTTNPEITEHTRMLRREMSASPQQHKNDSDWLQNLVEELKYRLSIITLLILYLIAFPFLCVLAASLLFYKYMFLMIRPLPTRKFGHIVIFLFSIVLTLLSFVLLVISLAQCAMLPFYFIVGLYLNGDFYSPYFLPISVFLFYSWTSWRYSVEIKYVELKMKIYEVCKESTPVQVTRSDSRGTHSDNNRETATQTIPTTLGRSTSTKRFKIELNDNGELVIPKPLYDLVREKFLPYDVILFHYFKGLICVAMFAYFLYMIMSLVQASGLSDSSRIISTMAAASLPFIIDIVWSNSSDVQKRADNLALTSKLKRVLTVHSSNNVTEEIVVEFTGTIYTPFSYATKLPCSFL